MEMHRSRCRLFLGAGGNSWGTLRCTDEVASLVCQHSYARYWSYPPNLRSLSDSDRDQCFSGKYSRPHRPQPRSRLRLPFQPCCPRRCPRCCLRPLWCLLHSRRLSLSRSHLLLHRASLRRCRRSCQYRSRRLCRYLSRRRFLRCSRLWLHLWLLFQCRHISLLRRRPLRQLFSHREFRQYSPRRHRRRFLASCRSRSPRARPLQGPPRAVPSHRYIRRSTDHCPIRISPNRVLSRLSGFTANQFNKAMAKAIKIALVKSIGFLTHVSEVLL